LRNTFEPYVAWIIKAGETSLIVIDAASFHKTEADNVKTEEFATIDLTLGTPIPDNPIPSSPRAFDFPEDSPMSEEKDGHGSK
jgi:hypothetical protein